MRWSDDKLRIFMDEDSDVKPGKGDFQHPKVQLEKMPRKKKVDRENICIFAATATVASGEEAQGIEDSVSPPASKDMETKIDDAPKNARELHAREEYDEIIKSGMLEIKQLLDMGVFVLPSDEEMEEIRAKNKRVLRCKMVYARKYESVECDAGQIRDRILKEREDWPQRAQEKSSRSTSWSTFRPTIGRTEMRTLIALMCRKGFDVRSYDLSCAFLGTDLAREVSVKLP